MKNRSPAAVFLLGFITLGFYSWYWAIKTKTEMNSKGNDIPTAWIWLIPIVGGIWWYWKYCEAVENVTTGKMSGGVAFLLIYLLGAIGQAIIQDTFNKVLPAAADMNGNQMADAAAPVTPEVVQAPTTSFEPAPEQPMQVQPADPTQSQPPTNPQPPTLVQ